MTISAPMRPNKRGWKTSQARPTRAATGTLDNQGTGLKSWVLHVDHKVHVGCETFSAFQPSAEVKARTRVQRPPAPATPTMWVKKTTNMDRPNNKRVLLSTRSSCRPTHHLGSSLVSQGSHGTLTWSLLGKQHRNRPRSRPASTPPPTSSSPLRMFVHVEPAEQEA